MCEFLLHLCSHRLPYCVIFAFFSQWRSNCVLLVDFLERNVSKKIGKKKSKLLPRRLKGLHLTSFLSSLQIKSSLWTFHCRMSKCFPSSCCPHLELTLQRIGGGVIQSSWMTFIAHLLLFREKITLTLEWLFNGFEWF